MKPIIKGINHIGIAPSHPEKTRWFFEECLELPYVAEQLVQSQKTNTIIFKSSEKIYEDHISTFEILEPQDGTDGPIAKYLSKKGGGIHHIAIDIDNVQNAIEHLQSKSVKMIDEKPRDGAHNTKIAFVHPQSTGGILVELVER